MRAGGAKRLHRAAECAQEKGKSGAARLSEKPGGLVKMSKRNVWQKGQNKLLLMYHMGPKESPTIKRSQKTVLN